MEVKVLSREEIKDLARECGREDRKVVGGSFVDGVYKTGGVTKKHFAGLKRRGTQDDLYVPAISFEGANGVGDFTISQITANGIKVVKTRKGDTEVEEPIVVENATTKSHRLMNEAVNPHLKGEEVDILASLQNKWVRITNVPVRVQTWYPTKGQVVTKKEAEEAFKTAVMRNLPHVKVLTPAEIASLKLE